MYERLHELGDNGHLLLKVRRKDFTIGKTSNEQNVRATLFRQNVGRLPVHNSKRTTLQQINVPEISIIRLVFNQYQRPHLWSLAIPLGATLSCSSLPNMFRRSPSGCGLASPKTSTNSGADMMDRNRCGFRWILDLDNILGWWSQLWNSGRVYTWWSRAHSSQDTRNQRPRYFGYQVRLE